MFVRSRARSNSDASDASISSDWTSVSSGSSVEKYMLANIPVHIRKVRRTNRGHADCSTESHLNQSSVATPSTSNQLPNQLNELVNDVQPSTSSNVFVNASSSQLQDQQLLSNSRAVPMDNPHNLETESDSDLENSSTDVEVNEYFESSAHDDDEEIDANSFDLSFIQLTELQADNEIQRRYSNPRLSMLDLHVLNLSSNCLQHIPDCIAQLKNLRSLDLSQNQLTRLNESLLSLNHLETLIVSNNQLNEQSLPKNMAQVMATNLKVLSLSGNQMHQIPDQVFDLISLKSLYLGGNQISYVSRKIAQLHNLQNLYLGGNLLEEIPHEVGMLKQLQALSLCENRLRELPSSIAFLSNLKSLALHRNELTALPPNIVKLRSLYELSLRDNPLVVRFVRDMVYNPPTLLELAGRCIKLHKLPADNETLPIQLLQYLRTAQSCVNPNCKGVYFDTRVEQIKFVDFCGIYRLPLLQYLCSPCCTGTSPANGASGTTFNHSNHNNNHNNNHSDLSQSRIRRVLLG